VLTQLRQAGLRVEIIDSDHSLEGVLHKVDRVATLLDKITAGEALKAHILQQVQSVQRRMPDNAGKQRPRIMFLLAAGGHGVSLAGKNTQAQALIELMGGSNVATEFSSYNPLSQEGALKAQPEVIIIAKARKGPKALDKYPALKLTPAFKQGRVVHADSMLLLGFGPRLPEAMARLAESFYPDISADIAMTPRTPDS